MKSRFWLFQRQGVFYVEDTLTGKQESLGTRDRSEAERIRCSKNEAAQQPFLGLALGRAYLAAHDPKLIQRTWEVVMDDFRQRGLPHTHRRRERAMRSRPFRLIRHLKLVETTADDLRDVLKLGGSSTNHFLRCLHNLAVGMGWLPGPILPSKIWPVAKPKVKRGITGAEHRRIVEAEHNVERRFYYELLWEVGAAQTDTSLLQAENIEWGRRVLQYQRRKTGEWACEVASISRTVRKGESSTMNPIKESPPKTRRKFDPTFKREAVGNWLSSGKSASAKPAPYRRKPPGLSWPVAMSKFSPMAARSVKCPGFMPHLVQVARRPTCPSGGS